MDTAWKAYKGLDHTENRARRAILQGLYTSAVPKEDWMDVLGLDKWEIWSA